MQILPLTLNLSFTKFEKKLPELRDTIDGYNTSEQTGKLKVIKAHHENLESRKAELEKTHYCTLLSLSAGTCHSSNHSWYHQ